MGKFLRKRYFIHPSSQIRYIAMSVLPALVMSIFCVQILISDGELILKKEHSKLSVGILGMNKRFNTTLNLLQEKHFAKEELTTIGWLLKEIVSIENTSQMSYASTLRQWAELKMQVLLAVFLILLVVGAISLIYSHRIAGPIYRLRSSIDMLAEGKSIPPVKLRQYDEFKELAESVEKLRKILKEKGYC